MPCARRSSVIRPGILLKGVFLVIAGVLALVYPYVASVALVFLIGWILIISGVLQGIGLIGAKEVPHFWLQLISSVLAIVIGLLLLRNPNAGLLIMTVLLIVFFIVEGFSKIIFALNIRPVTGWVFVLLSGIIGILLGAYLWEQHAAQLRMGARRSARHSADLRGRRARLPRVDDPQQLAESGIGFGSEGGTLVCALSKTLEQDAGPLLRRACSRSPLRTGRFLDVARIHPARLRRGRPPRPAPNCPCGRRTVKLHRLSLPP